MVPLPKGISMSRYDQTNVSSIAGVNSELQKVQAAIATLLDLYGEAPNSMESDFDMNSFDILNASHINGQKLTISGIEIGAGGVDIASDYNWTGAHTYTTLPTYNSYDFVTTDTLSEQVITITEQTGVLYTTVLADRGTLIQLNNASSIALTIPPNADVAYPTGTTLTIVQTGLGQVTVTPGSGVTINTEVGLTVAARYGFVTLVKTETNTWLASGSLI